MHVGWPQKDFGFATSAAGPRTLQFAAKRGCDGKLAGSAK